MKRQIVEPSFSVQAMLNRKQAGQLVNVHPNFHKVFAKFAESDRAAEIDQEMKAAKAAKQ
jgi:hypothetical protein